MIADAASVRAKEGGALTGPNPVDRGTAGSKLHVLTDAQGLLVVVGVSAANVNDVQALRPLILGIPAVRSRRAALVGDVQTRFVRVSRAGGRGRRRRRRRP
ncbi:transposase [Streptomyces tuirus]|uniref:transposase n=1 Tax=Streptomyces tuirus TaxID=68278 RepID=UPI0016834D91